MKNSFFLILLVSFVWLNIGYADEVNSPEAEIINPEIISTKQKTAPVTTPTPTPFPIVPSDPTDSTEPENSTRTESPKRECLACGFGEFPSCGDEELYVKCSTLDQSCSTTTFKNGTVIKGCAVKSDVFFSNNNNNNDSPQDAINDKEGCSDNGPDAKTCLCKGKDNCNNGLRFCWSCGIAGFKSCKEGHINGSCSLAEQSCSTTIQEDGTVSKGCLVGDHSAKARLEGSGRYVLDGRTTCVCNEDNCNAEMNCDNVSMVTTQKPEDPKTGMPSKGPKTTRKQTPGPIPTGPVASTQVTEQTTNVPWATPSSAFNIKISFDVIVLVAFSQFVGEF